MTAPVRFALIGYGFGGRWFHAPFLASSDRCQLVGVVTRSPQRRALVEADHPGTRTFDSLDAAVDAGVEAVAISTPAATHSELTDAAIELGLHVVCDKPFALDAAAAARSIALTERRGVVLTPFQNRRWDSDFLTVRKLIDTGALGEVVGFESRFERYAPDAGPGPSGGGTLLDFGSHLVDQAFVLFGSVDQVYAEWRIRDNGLDDDVFIALTHASGHRSHLWGGWSEHAPGLRFRVTGTEAAYVVDGPMDGQEAALLRGEDPSTLGAAWGAEPQDRWGSIHRGTGAPESQPSEHGAWPLLYDGFAAAVRGEGRPPIAAADAVATAAVLDAARRSATTGEVVRVEAAMPS